MDYTYKLDEVMKHLTTTGAFLTSGNREQANPMTISWGFIGVMWGKPHFITVVRPQRYTKEFLDQANSFTISVPFGCMKEELTVIGTKSGRELDKSQVVKLISAQEVDSPVVAGCQMYYECKIRYVDDFKEEKLPEWIRSSFYKGDYHAIYFGEIVACYEKAD